MFKFPVYKTEVELHYKERNCTCNADLIYLFTICPNFPGQFKKYTDTALFFIFIYL